MNPFIFPEQQYGTTLESLLERRERVAKSEGASFGVSKMFMELSDRIISELPTDGGKVLEVDAGAGLFTKTLLARGYTVTAIEPVPVLYERLNAIQSKQLTAYCGFVEDFSFPCPDNKNQSYALTKKQYEDALGGESDAAASTTEPFATPSAGGAVGSASLDDGALNTLANNREPVYDSAVVTFPARRGRGIFALICEILPLVKGKVMVVLPDDGSVDWSSTLRAVSLKGFKATAQFVVELPAVEAAKESGQTELGQVKRAMLLTVDATPLIDDPLCPSQVISAWGAAIRVIEVPYPVPRGAATRLIRYFRAGGDRSILIKTEPDGMHHLYGNLRTAAHRIARDQIAVRRVDNGIQLMQIIRSEMPVREQM